MLLRVLLHGQAELWTWRFQNVSNFTQQKKSQRHRQLLLRKDLPEDALQVVVQVEEIKLQPQQRGDPQWRNLQRAWKP
jgi:hypothetical protein